MHLKRRVGAENAEVAVAHKIAVLLEPPFPRMAGLRVFASTPAAQRT